ncbi:hypothetical protein ACQEU5_07975 [Marinactinospora thermotolerans]|uniref:hypothetical protein n=1 Tax=Marinactinospora thermotolerans TaxID=531310 RepID=UPI003D8B8F38
MLILVCFEYGHVDPRGLLDERHEVAQRLHPQVLLSAEPFGGGPAFGFSTHV